MTSIWNREVFTSAKQLTLCAAACLVLAFFASITLSPEMPRIARAFAVLAIAISILNLVKHRPQPAFFDLLIVGLGIILLFAA